MVRTMSIVAMAVGAWTLCAGCVSQGEFNKLADRVAALETAQRNLASAQQVTDARVSSLVTDQAATKVKVENYAKEIELVKAAVVQNLVGMRDIYRQQAAALTEIIKRFGGTTGSAVSESNPQPSPAPTKQNP